MPGDAPTGGEAIRRSKPFSVLVVDDEPDVLESIKNVLTGDSPGLEVATATSGSEGLETLASRTVDLIVADYRMTPMDGLEFLIHARKEAPGVPRVMVTAHPDIQVAVQAVNRGHVVGFFLKPIEPESLLTVVRDAMSERAKQGDRARALAQTMDALRRGARARPRGGQTDEETGVPS